MRVASPAFIPRNHLVEEALSAAVNNGEFAPFERLLTVLRRPYEDQPDFGRYANPPRSDKLFVKHFAALDVGRTLEKSVYPQPLAPQCRA